MANKVVKDFNFSPSFGFTGSAGKTPVKAYMRGGKVDAPKACACGGKAMKKGGASKKSSAKSSKASKASKTSRAEKQMAEGLMQQMMAQAAVTGRMPGVPAPGARGVPVPSQAPLVGMKKGGSSCGLVGALSRSGKRD